MLKNIFIVLLGLVSSYSYADVKVNKERTMIIDGIIAGPGLVKLGAALIDMANTDVTKPIDIVINSPGGSVTSGFLFINQMEAAKGLGATIRCFVPNLAASMAFQILVHCSERYTLDRAFLLYHRVRVVLGGGLFSTGETVTSPMAKALAVDLGRMDQVIFNECLAVLNMPYHAVSYHFEHETFHVGQTMATEAPGFINSLSYVEGLYEALGDKSLPRMETLRGDKSRSLFNNNEIVYIMPYNYLMSH